MNDKNINYGQVFETNNNLHSLARARRRIPNDGDSTGEPCIHFHAAAKSRAGVTRAIGIAVFTTAALLFGTTGCSLRQAYPETEIRGYINGQPFSVRAPKDANLTGFDAVTATNGSVHVHIDSLQASLNATNLANAASGQAAIVTATGQVINEAVQTATATAIKAATGK